MTTKFDVAISAIAVFDVGTAINVTNNSIVGSGEVGGVIQQVAGPEIFANCCTFRDSGLAILSSHATSGSRPGT